MNKDYRYIFLEWTHTSSDSPIFIYSEIDEEGWETRKVEVFRDGKMAYASENVEHGTGLGEKPDPPGEIKSKSPAIKITVISANDFEAIWKRATEDSFD